MRFPSLPSCLLLSLALAAGQARAQDKSAEGGKPGTTAKGEHAPPPKTPPRAPHGDLVEAAYLGLVTEAIPLERAGDLGLPPGTGLSVVAVAPGSPAEKSGFQKHDVLTKLDEHLLVNPAQLRVLVRLRKGGDAVAVQLVRKGKAQTLKAELGSRPMPELTPGGEEPREDRLPGGFRSFPIPPNGQMPPELREELERMHRGFGRIAPNHRGDGEDDDDKDDGDAKEDKGAKAGQSF